MRKITFCQATNEAMSQEMERDPSVFVYGIGASDHKRIFGSTNDLVEKFGPQRCFDTPVSEDCMTGFGLGAALNGLKPIHIHIRVDFLLLAMNQLANMLSTYLYVSGGKMKVPMVIRAIVGRGLGQGCQHSKSMQSTFAHIPGLKVIMPTTPYDVKGLLISAIRDPNPVISIEHRWLYWQEGEVPEEPYTVPIGQPNIIRSGTDITVVATSWMNIEAIHAAKILSKKHGVNVEIIDARTITPSDDSIIIESVLKTGMGLIADNDWTYCGYSSELSSNLHYKCFGRLKSPIERIGFSHSPCPTVRHLEDKFYPNAKTIVRTIEKMLKLNPVDLEDEDFYSHENKFIGPF